MRLSFFKTIKNKELQNKHVTWWWLSQPFFISLICAFIAQISVASPSIEGIQTYQNNIHLYPEHKQKLADDIVRYRNADNLWDVLREEFTLPHYENNPAVQQKIEWFMNNQDYLLRSATRAGPYLYYILQQVRKRHLPAELVLLPIVESGYNPFSLSNMGAEGIWQLMPGTASGLGVKQDWWYDGRRDVIASTRAALNYLAYLQSFFDGNWLLAMAAYNTGEGNVLAAIRRNIRDGRDTDFWSLPVAQQTRDYVPSLLALAVIISHPRQYPVYFPPIRNAPYLAQIDMAKQINLRYAASLAGITHQKIMQLNPGFNRLVTTRKGTYKLVLPIENVEQFTENLAHSPLNNSVDWQHYKVKSGDTFASVSKKFHTSVDEIRKMNKLSKNNLKPGMHLLIPSRNTSTTTETISDTPATESIPTPTAKQEIILATTKAGTSKYTLQPGDTVYMVRAKDTINGIAKRFKISTQQLLAANHAQRNNITSGKQIVIPTHLLSAASKNKSIVPGDTLYMVRHGDTIEKIAQKFHTSPSAIRLTNLVDNSMLSEGQKLVIPTHIHS